VAALTLGGAVAAAGIDVLGAVCAQTAQLSSNPANRPSPK